MLKPIMGQLIVILIYAFFLIRYIKKKTPLYKHLYLFLFFIYLSEVVAVTLFPLPIDQGAIEMRRKDQFLHNNFIPFSGIVGMIKGGDFKTILRNIFGNILLLAPLGFFIPLVFEKIKKFKHVVIIGLISSIGIETMQFIISCILGFTYKITDVDDVILNTIGTACGFLAYKIFVFLKK